MDPTFIAIIIAVVILLAIFVMVSYVKAPPSYAFIISGLSKEPRVLIGSGGFRVPFFERLDKVYLGQITVDIKTEESVPTNDFINVDVDAVAKIRVTPNPEGTRLAAKNFLNMTPVMIAEQLQDSLQGNMREIIGTLDLRSLNTDRDGFSDQGCRRHNLIWRNSASKSSRATSRMSPTKRDSFTTWVLTTRRKSRRMPASTAPMQNAM